MTTRNIHHSQVQSVKLNSNKNENHEIVEEDAYTKYSYFPIQHKILEKYYQTQKNVIWTPAELDFTGGRSDWEDSSKLDPGAKNFIKSVLAFFAQADGIVNENIMNNFKQETSKLKEARAFYCAQEFIETIHNETYSLFIEAFIRDDEEKIRTFNAIENDPSVKKMAEWAFKWMNQDIPLTERIVAFACIEGIFFSSAFAAIYWIKKRNILRELCKANEWIARDEAIHTEFAIALYHVLTEQEKMFEPLSQERVHQIIKSATDTCEQFTRESLKVDLIGMNAPDMIKYVQCTSNRLSTALGYNPIYNVENPFDWMKVISLPNKSNFFETQVSEYSRQSVSDFSFDEDEDF